MPRTIFTPDPYLAIHRDDNHADHQLHPETFDNHADHQLHPEMLLPVQCRPAICDLCRGSLPEMTPLLRAPYCNHGSPPPWNSRLPIGIYCTYICHHCHCPVVGWALRTRIEVYDVSVHCTDMWVNFIRAAPLRHFRPRKQGNWWSVFMSLRPPCHTVVSCQ